MLNGFKISSSEDVTALEEDSKETCPTMQIFLSLNSVLESR